ncbi:hypothetical protein QJS10_CPA09g00971 [Acorus calamus]|uniref:Membralin n=1 Tax=Acorus calamus TaxID=4465 RepID=A0AAV9E402_ACOCL|nr:hypothetical protein QJS10_CPA09g00971 [Acorus calamus]
MDPEQTFLRVHARLSGMLSQLLTPRIRLVLEYIYLVIAVALFCLLVVMHANFVQQPGCSSELSGVEVAEAQLVQIKITSADLWTPNVADQNAILEHIGPSESTGIANVENAADSCTINTDTDGTEIMVDTEAPRVEFPISARESFKLAMSHFSSKWHVHCFTFWKIVKRLLGSYGRFWSTAGWTIFLDIPKWIQKFRLKSLHSFSLQWLEKRSKAFEPTYLYTVEKGYFLLPEGAKLRHNVRTVNVSISAGHSCFGNRWQRLLINTFVGYDTILMNSLLSSPGQGYLYNFQTKEFYDLRNVHEPPEVSSRFEGYLVTKCGVLIMSLFVFFTTTMSVSFTLRETQSRMLKFTVQLQHHARHQLPTFQLIFIHVIESLVFVPIMIGILFFLFEFYDDQLLAFLVLVLVWLCELFTMISVRTPMSMQFFPRFFLLYFLMFHIYFFSYSYGFSYLAFSTTAAFMQHLILYFWNRFEVPALQRFMQNRNQLQQQSGVHITSSTILTSTLHIARVNVRTSNANNELVPGEDLRSSPGATKLGR